MTLKEIAREAGVSVSTVSRIVNQKNTKAASAEVQARIWEIVRRSGYTPNTMARNLKLGQSASFANEHRSIACIYARSTSSTDLFFSQIAKGIELEAFKSNCFIKHSFTELDIANPELSRFIGSIAVDGVVVLGRYDKQMLKFLNANYNYVIYTGLNPMSNKYDQVVCEGDKISEAAIEYLHELGHRKIAYIGEANEELRYTGYRQTLERLQLPYKSSYTANVRLSPEGGYQGVRMLIENSADVTAVYCANDNTAIGAIHALKEHGLRIPADISVIAVDDLETSQYISPMLTTVHVPMEELGRMSAKILIDRLNGGHKLPLKLVLPFYIAKRDSCAAPNPERTLLH